MRAPVPTLSLALVAANACFASSSGVYAAGVPITEEARMHFAAGVALLQDPKAPRYEEAYREFKAAYAAAPSYEILGNLGLRGMKIERDAEAINAYETSTRERRSRGRTSATPTARCSHPCRCRFAMDTMSSPLD
jgi:hypothetical protein